MNTKMNPNDAVTENEETKGKKDNPKSMRFTPNTIKRLSDAKYLVGARTWDDVVNFLLDDSVTVNSLANGFPSRAEEVRQMGMLLSKMLELFKSSWSMSSDAEERVTQKMKGIIVEKDNAIAALKAQLGEGEATRAELQEHIEKLTVELDTMRRERDASQTRADMLAQAIELSKLIKEMQSAVKTAEAANVSESNNKQEESPVENETHELLPEDVDALDEYDNRHPTVGVEPPF